MSVKDKTLSVLENNKGNYISGAELAKELSVSRNAIWKAIKSLKDEGYNKIRITIYRSKAIAPFEIVCGIYGLMFHTVFAKDIADDLVLNEAEFCHSFTDKW